MLDAIVDADDHEAAVSAIAELLGKSTLGAEAVLGMRLNQLTKAERRKNQAELDDLNSTLTFTLAERPASSGDTSKCAPSAPTTTSSPCAPKNSRWPATDRESPRARWPTDRQGRTARRRRGRSVAGRRGGGHQVGLIFGELSDGEGWMCASGSIPTSASRLRRCRTAQVAVRDGVAVPGVPMVVRGPSS